MGTLKDKMTKKKKIYKMEIDEKQGSGVYAISLVSDPAIEAQFVYLSKQLKPIKLAQVDGEKRILVGPVLIPNKEIPRVDDQTGEEYSIIFTPDVVEKAAQLFLQQQKNNEATIEHTDKKVPDVSVVESWIVEDPNRDKQNTYGMDYPKGTWMIKMKINNDKVWQEYVKTGEVKGFSLEGMFGHELVEATWGVEDVPSSDSAQSWPNNTQYPHGIANRPNNVPRNTRNMDNKYPATGFPATRFSVQMSKEEADTRLEEIVSLMKQYYLENESEIQFDSEVFMAQKSLESIAKAVEDLKAKLGTDEQDVPAWIQDHITNADNYINQANDGFYFEDEITMEGESGTTTSITSSYTGQFGPATAKKKNKKKTKLAAGAALEVFGYNPQYISISQEITKIFTDLVAKNPNPQAQALIRQAAISADKLLHIETRVIKRGVATSDDLENAQIVAKDYITALTQVDKILGTNTDFSYIQDHLDTISGYIDTSLSSY